MVVDINVAIIVPQAVKLHVKKGVVVVAMVVVRTVVLEVVNQPVQTIVS